MFTDRVHAQPAAQPSTHCLSQATNYLPCLECLAIMYKNVFVLPKQSTHVKALLIMLATG